ncbi:MAG: thiamine pyrophosphate-binding protein [Hyphomicrobiaceae bacterium]|nr:thiamine pyrophosphate-binding protein [Hyphomicrobiaceae bacterium]
MAIGSDIVAKALKHEGVSDFFYIMGGPMLAVEKACLNLGLRGIDVRHEQAAAFAGFAYARLKNQIGVCMAASGPATTNLVTGVAHAWADCTPILALGGAAPVSTWHRGAFQDTDQLALFKPITKWADRVHNARRIPELVNLAISQAMTGRTGPVYLDLPGDILYQEVDESKIEYPEPFVYAKRARPAINANDVKAIVDALSKAKQPVLVTGSGVQWSEADAEMLAFVEASGIPFYTTPQGRGVIPEDHKYSYLTSRAAAFKDADVILVVGTRMNYVIGNAAPPRWNAGAKVVRIDIDPVEIATAPRKLDIGVVADAKIAFGQLTEAIKGKVTPAAFETWRERLRTRNVQKAAEAEQALSNNDSPIHPLRLCKEVRDILDRDAVLCVDGQETLNYARQAIPQYTARHRINSGAYGTMGVGMPFGMGAKAACPDKQVVVLHGDGSWGMNSMEFDTCVRHKLPVLVVISQNGGWTGDPDKNDPAKSKPGRELGYPRYDKFAECFGGHGEYVEKPEDIRPALERAMAAVKAGKPALVCVVTDWKARATTTAFTRYST